MILSLISSGIREEAYAAENKEKVYSDVAGHPFEEALNYVIKHGLMSNKKSEIFPDAKLTKGAASLSLNNLLGASDLYADMNTVGNLKVGDKYYQTVSIGLNCGYLKQKPNKDVYYPLAKATYGYLADIFSSVLGIDMKDEIVGDHDPKDTLTRGEYAFLLQKLAPNIITKNTKNNVLVGDVYVTKPNITLANITVEGNLIITDAVDDKDVLLRNVVIKGKLIVRGGGENSVYLMGNSKVPEVVIQQVNHTVSLKVQENAIVGDVYVNKNSSGVNIYGEVETLTVAASSVDIALKEAKIEKVVLIGKSTSLSVAKDTKVSSMVVGKSAEDSIIEVEGSVDTIHTVAKGSNIKLQNNGKISLIKADKDAGDLSVEVSKDALIGKVESEADNISIRGEGSVGSENVSTVTDDPKIIITGKVSKLIILGNAEITLDKATIGTIEIVGDSVKLVVNSGSTVDDVTVSANKIIISGNGTVRNVKVTEKAKEGVEILTVPTIVTIDTKAGAVKTKNGTIQPGTTVTTYEHNQSYNSNNSDSVIVKKYSITVLASDGGTVNSASGNYAEGTNLNLQATPNVGYSFSNWETSNGGTFTSANSATTTFTTPANATTITAVFKEDTSSSLALLYDTTDTDEDGLSDYIETLVGTDGKNADTDGDGLRDGFEYTKTLTSPLLKDTNGNGIQDDQEDVDDDLLSNIREQELGTDPNNVDTDGDSLSDYAEVETYNTDPLDSDTDGDGIDDGDEIMLGLDPTKSSTDGVTPDGDRTFPQMLSNENFNEELLSTDAVIIPSISGNVKGVIDNNVIIEVANIDVFDDNRAVIGKVIDINSGYEGTPLTLAYDVSKIITEYDETFAKGLVICQVGGIDGLTPLTTAYDNGKISTNIINSGEYLVLNVDEFLSLFGIDIMANIVDEAEFVSEFFSMFIEGFEFKTPTNSEVAPKGEPYDEPKTSSDNINDETSVESSEEINVAEYSSDNLSNSFEALAESISATASNSSTGIADIVFVVDTTGSMGENITKVGQEIKNFSSQLYNSYNVTANLAIVEYFDYIAYGNDGAKVHKNGYSNWFSNLTAFQSKVDYVVSLCGRGSYETAIDGLEMARQLDWRANANKFIVFVTDEDYYTQNRYGISSMNEEISLLKSSGITVYVITESNLQNTYRSLWEETGGDYLNIDGDFGTQLLVMANKIGDITTNGTWIILDDYQQVRLNDVAEDPDEDTDDDGIKDYDELRSKKTVNLWYWIEFLLKARGINPNLYVGKTSIEVWSYNSNPTKYDTDNDSIDDRRDIKPRTNNTDIPDVFKSYINKDIIAMEKIITTDDGFSLCTVSIADLLKTANIDQTSLYTAMDYYDDWYVYAILKDNGAVYSLLKLREPENDGKDGDDAGVAISFAEYDVNKLNYYIVEINGNIANDKSFDDAISNVIYSDKAKHNETLQQYFAKTKSKAPYLIADEYVNLVSALNGGNDVTFTPQLNSKISTVEMYESLLRNPLYQPNVLDMRRYNSANRIPTALKSLNDSNGKDIVDFENKVIDMREITNNHNQRKAILAMTTADISYNMFAAEIEFHADALTDLRAIFKDWYTSAVIADMSLGEEYESGVFDEYYNTDSSLVKNQIKEHGEK